MESPNDTSDGSSSGNFDCTCTERPTCGCNATAIYDCSCLVPRCRQCYGRLPRVGTRMNSNLSSMNSNSDSCYVGIPRTTSRIHTDGRNWGTNTAIYTINPGVQAQQSSTMGFTHLPMVHQPAVEAVMNSRGAVALPQVPFAGIVRHNTTIMNAEASMLHQPPRNPQAIMTNGNQGTNAHLGPRDRDLISSCTENRYVFTPGNSPVQLPRPRASLAHRQIEQQPDNTHNPHLRGGGKTSGSRKSKAKPKAKAKKSVWDDEKILAEDSSFLYTSNSRSKIRALIDRPASENLIPSSSVRNLPVKQAQRAVEIFQNDGLCRFNDPEFISEAISASSRRRQGDFDGFEAHQFAENWIDPESSEEYGDEDVDMSNTKPGISGFDGAAATRDGAETGI